ncbi:MULTISPECIES: P1 family peptidase [Lysinibacillus]|jgi:L-aminopeptidase/D-esterase-like protein|uniref:P1 family peptidase n=1 Tax=Lysinibacillus TaxID=400634 RepID=UPI0004D69041|nr:MULTISPECIES: P1 family peptidase [Lysinibacillus]MDC6266202.1 P1 family peptidase [Lysinibacillus sphaericus]AJK88371.1 peptidase S58 [Lysinibacillus fusiformis]KAB0442508.1 peptidase S58 family protein [Lysinibacillus fusiformis]KGA84285.1 peptidase S58 [Lysinibacillus fusiformis]KHK49909.1 peptidase S58 [Lysinibacillus sp. A1]
MFGNITDVPGIKVGHRENEEGITGCTALLMEGGAVCGVDVRGSAPGTRETDALDPINEIDRVHGICLSGGSAFGLDAATGVMQFLEERGIGVDAGVAKIPIVPSAVLFDLFIGDPQARPTALMGYEAAQAAQVGSFQNGNIGAGYGATVGKLAGPDFAMKGGLGSASIAGKDGLIAGAIVAVNAVGDVKNPNTRQILAGARNPQTGQWLDCCAYLEEHAQSEALAGTNTTIGVVALNAKLTKAEAKKIAQLTQNALARTIYPVHTMLDGDTIFVLGTGEQTFALDYLGHLATKVMEEAILAGIQAAEKLAGVESYTSIQKIST